MGYFFLSIFGLLFSVPVLLLYDIVFSYIPYKRISLKTSKWVFNALIISCILAPYYILDNFRISWNMFVYPAAVIISSLLLKLKATEDINVVG